MKNIKIMVLGNSDDILDKLKRVLNSNGYYNIELTTSGSELLRKSRFLNVDLYLIEDKIHDIGGIEVALDLFESSISNIILLVSRTSHSYASQVLGGGDVVVIPKPVNSSVIMQAVNIFSSKIVMVKKLNNEVQKLKKSLDDKKIIEKAKWYLIEKFEMTEPEAYRFLQKLSMDKRMSMRSIADEILTQS